MEFSSIIRKIQLIDNKEIKVDIAQIRLTYEQKLQALADKYYSSLEWIPKVGDYYTTCRADLELYKIVAEENGQFLTVYCDSFKGNSVSYWKKESFLQEFGTKRIWVYPRLLGLPVNN